jgi:hypothetical protein
LVCFVIDRPTVLYSLYLLPRMLEQYSRYYEVEDSVGCRFP